MHFREIQAPWRRRCLLQVVAGAGTYVFTSIPSAPPYFDLPRSRLATRGIQSAAVYVMAHTREILHPAKEHAGCAVSGI